MVYNNPNNYNPYSQGGMSYNNSYPVQSSAQIPQDQPRNSAELIFISNIQQAREFIVPPNTIKYFLNTVDSEIYAKSSDTFGITSFKASKLVDFDPNVPQTVQGSGININDLASGYNSLASRVAALENELIKTSQTTPDYLDNGGSKNESRTKHDGK